eukprot:2532893-Pyramimonas_sp.AAC.2
MACIDQDVVAISLYEGQPLTSRWIAPVVEVDGRQFVVVDRQDSSYTRFAGQRDMLDYIIHLRNQATDRMMRELSRKEDPTLGPHDDVTYMPKRPKRELIDDIAPTTSVEVEVDHGGKYTVIVCTCKNLRNKLCIESTPDAIKLLTMKPAWVRSSGLPEPTFQGDVVRWYRSRHAVGVNYYDKQKATWRLKTMKVPPGEDLQSRAESMAAVLETFYAQHHTPPGLVADQPQPSPVKH